MVHSRLREQTLLRSTSTPRPSSMRNKDIPRMHRLVFLNKEAIKMKATDIHQSHRVLPRTWVSISSSRTTLKSACFKYQIQLNTLLKAQYQTNREMFKLLLVTREVHIIHKPCLRKETPSEQFPQQVWKNRSKCSIKLASWGILHTLASNITISLIITLSAPSIVD